MLAKLGNHACMHADMGHIGLNADGHAVHCCGRCKQQKIFRGSFRKVLGIWSSHKHPKTAFTKTSSWRSFPTCWHISMGHIGLNPMGMLRTAACAYSGIKIFRVGSRQGLGMLASIRHPINASKKISACQIWQSCLHAWLIWVTSG